MQPFRVGDWTAYPKRDAIEGPDGTVRIEPRVMQVLVALAARPDDVVTREELLETVWNGTFVSDEVLTNAIRELRKALADDAKSPRYIQTLPKKGYRLVAPVQVLEARTPPAARAWLSVPAAGLLAAIAWWSWPDTVTPPPTATRITTLEGEEQDAALSPDGTRIAFARYERGGETYHLYVMTAGGGDAVKVSESANVDSPTWSRDGEWLAFVRAEFVDERWRGELRVVRALGGDERLIAVIGGHYDSSDWSPDGEWLAVSDRESDGHANAIYLYAMASGERRRLTNPHVPLHEETGDKDPRFSPDGAMVAFTRVSRPRREDIHVQRIDGSADARRLTFANGDIAGFDWVPDGSGLVYSDRERMYYVSLDSREPVPLGFGEGAHSVSIAGERLAYTVGNADSDIWRVPGPGALPDDEPSRLATSSAWDVWPRYSPDGSRFLFVSTRTGPPQIWMCDASAKDRACEQITFFEDGAATPSWSPDGNRIAFAAHFDRDEGSELYVMDVEDRLPQRLTTDDRFDRAPSWSGDGETLYFTSQSSESEAELWKMSLARGDAKRIGDVHGVNPRESGDGRFLYYSKHAGFAPIARIPIDGGVEEIVLAEDIPHRSWDLLEGQLVYHRQGNGGRYIDTLDLETMETRPRNQPFDTLNWGLSVSPDGRWALISHWDVAEIDVMLVDDFLSALPR